MDLFQEYKGKNVLITGDTGFKGSWLAIWLLHLGANVTGFGLPPRNKEDNYNVSGLDTKIHHIDGDIRNFTNVSETIKKCTPDFVFHLAAQALVLDSFEDPYTTFETNIGGTLNVLEAIRKNSGISAAVIVTSDKCYENKDWVHGYRETDPLGGKDPYSASKGAAEIVTSSYIHSFFSSPGTTSVATVRAGNVVGGGDWSNNRIIPDCIRSLNQNRPINIRNPLSVRPWQHVLEPLYGYLKLGRALYNEGKKYSGPWNFGPHPLNAVTVEHLAKEIIRQWGSGTYHVSENEKRNAESRMLTLDISKAAHVLQWHPILSLEQALKYTIDEYKIDGWSEDAVFCQRCAHIEKYMDLQGTV
jgi:CDP-glucose 4,6-dehydratase